MYAPLEPTPCRCAPGMAKTAIHWKRIPIFWIIESIFHDSHWYVPWGARPRATRSRPNFGGGCEPILQCSQHVFSGMQSDETPRLRQSQPRRNPNFSSDCDIRMRLKNVWAWQFKTRQKSNRDAAIQIKKSDTRRIRTEDKNTLELRKEWKLSTRKYMTENLQVRRCSPTQRKISKTSKCIQ